jgi:hypothetical protein
MDKVHKPSDSLCYTPSSEPFIFYLQLINLFVWSQIKKIIKEKGRYS